MAEKYCLIYDMGDCVDGIRSNDMDYLKEIAIEILTNWLVEERSKWKVVDDFYSPTSNQIEDYDYMIDEYHVYIAEYNKECDDYYDEDMNYWYPSDEQLKEIGWMPYEELISLC